MAVQSSENRPSDGLFSYNMHESVEVTTIVSAVLSRYELNNQDMGSGERGL